jgi:hypothetical protein
MDRDDSLTAHDEVMFFKCSDLSGRGFSEPALCESWSRPGLALTSPFTLAEAFLKFAHGRRPELAKRQDFKRRQNAQKLGAGPDHRTETEGEIQDTPCGTIDF